MEIVIPAAALASLFFINKNATTEGFTLPNTDMPDRNFPPEYESVSEPLDKTSKLITQNKTEVNHVYTDKYFLYNSTPENTSQQFTSLTGQNVGSDYFQHNNMTPFFGSKIRTNHTADTVNESILDSYSGTGSQILNKKETAPLFAPQNNSQWAHGMPNTSDFIQSRVVPTQKMDGVKPFEEIKVAPGIGLGYTSEGAGGYNSGVQARDLWKDYTVDELRTANKPKASGIGLLGHEGPATHFVQYRGEQGHQEKHGPPTFFENTPERNMKTTGVKQSTLVPVHIMHEGARPETSVSYQGGAGFYNTGEVLSGEYQPARGHEQGQQQFTPASATGKGAPTEEDYQKKALSVYTNNRTVNSASGDYFGSVRGHVNEAMAPLMDILKPTRKQHTVNNIRTYQNPKTAVTQPYVFNPERAKTTIRQTTPQSDWMATGGPRVTSAYVENTHQPADNARRNQSDFYYVGPSQSGAKHTRNYDAEYAIRNNGDKERTIDHAYTPSGNTKLFNSNMNMPTSDQKENLFRNSRDGMPTFATVGAHTESIGVSTVGDHQLYMGQQMDRMQAANVKDQLKNNPFFNVNMTGGL